MTEEQAIAAIQTATPNPNNFVRRGRGYVDWKFSEVALYLGYQAAEEYVATVRRWHDFETKFAECELIKSHSRFLELATKKQI
jgi:hypothetical protein